MKRLSAEIISDISLPYDLDLSPDGTKLAYALSRMGKDSEFPKSSLWVASVEEVGNPVQFTKGTYNDRRPRWSPDAKTIAFLSDRMGVGVHQLHLLSVNGNESSLIAFPQDNQSILDFDWSPDGKSIAFTSVTRSQSAGVRVNDPVEVYGKDLAFSRLRLLSVETGETRTLVDTNRYVRDFVWSPNGKELVYILQQSPAEEWQSREMTVERVNTDSQSKPEQVCTFPWLINTPIWSTNGQSIYFLGPINQQASRKIHVVSLADKKALSILGNDSCAGGLVKTFSDRLVALEWKGLATQLSWIDPKNHDTFQTLFSSPDETKTIEINEAAVRQSERGDISFAGVCCSAESPWEVYGCYSNSPIATLPSIHQISNHNTGLKEINWGRQESIEWKASDGLELDGLLIWPPEYSGSVPMATVVLVHGGPYGRYSNGFHLGWMDWGQWLATAGYLVFMVNPRGGSGHGEKFAAMAKGDVGGKDYEDVMAGIDTIIERGHADPNLLAIGGWSQGGFMSACAVTKTNRFKAAVMGAGVTDWETLVATSNVPDFERDLAGRAPWDEEQRPNHTVGYSPIKYAMKVSTPVLILHGAEDDRIPLGQALGFYRALKEKGVPTEFVIYPRERHLILERSHQIDLLNRIRSWYDRWLK